MFRLVSWRGAIAPMLALIALAAACSSGGDPDDAAITVAEPGVVVTAPSSGAGDTIAFCSLASGTTRAVDAEAVITAFDEMTPVAPSTIAPALAAVSDAWVNGETATDEVAAASDELEAYVLEECGIVAEFDPPTS